ncbi:MAG: DUF3333 domain-containing protein [Gammaproteobacteria bacterium]
MNYADAACNDQPANSSTFEIVQSSLAKRRAAERRFRLYGIAGIAAGLLFLLVLLVDIAGKGYTAFLQTQIQLDVHFDPAVLDPGKTRTRKKDLYRLISSGAAFELRDKVLDDVEL